MIDLGHALSPAYPLILAGLLLPFLRAKLQDGVFLAAPLVALALVWLMSVGAAPPIAWLGLSLTPVAVDATARLFGTAFAVAAAAGALFALDQKNVTERAAALVYAGAAQGVVFAGDLVTLFVYWEIMAVGSTLVILSNGAGRAGLRYAWMHVFGGVLFFAGIAAVAGTSGIAIRPFRADSAGTWLMLAGILVNAAAPPVSAWVADAYPKASWSGAVFLSAFTTKAAVAVLIRLFPGEPVLVGLGLVMALYGLLYALLEDDIRKLLSYSIVGQVGFMVVAVGIGTPLALAAAGVHAFSHILYKALLMMGAGTIFRAAGTASLSELGGLASRLRLTTVAILIGGFSLAAMPLTAGFVSKSAIMYSLGEAHAAVAWFGLTAISAGSFLYAGLKLPWFALLRPAAPRPLEPIARSMSIAMAGLALGILVLGIFPGLMARLAPGIATVPILTPDHILFQLQLLAGAAICFVLLLKLLEARARITLDFDWLWRELPDRAMRPALGLARFIRTGLSPAFERLHTRTVAVLPFWTIRLLESGNWRTGDVALAATALLGLALIIAAL